MKEKNMIAAKRMKQCRLATNETLEQIGVLIGVHKTTVRRWETGETERISLPIIQKLAMHYNVSPAWLMGADVPMERMPFSETNDELFENYDNIHPVRLKKFPMLGKIACGEPIWADEDRDSFVMADMDINADFCLTAKGDSMINARIYDGDIVFIRKMPIVKNGDIAAVIIDNEATLKRVYYYPEKNKLILNPENPQYEPLVYINEELDTIRILGKAVYFMSAL